MCTYEIDMLDVAEDEPFTLLETHTHIHTHMNNIHIIHTYTLRHNVIPNMHPCLPSLRVVYAFACSVCVAACIYAVCVVCVHVLLCVSVPRVSAY